MTLAEIRAEILFSFRYPRVRASIAGFAFAALFGLAIGAAYWFPLMRSFDKLQVEIDDRRRDIANKEYNLKLAQASARAARQMAQIEKKLDITVTQGELVQNMAMLARRNNVKIISEAYEEGKPQGDYSPLVHEIVVQAGYAELRSFIAGVQQLPSLTIVQEAVLSRTSNLSVLKAQLNIITYRRAVRPQI